MRLGNESGILYNKNTRRVELRSRSRQRPEQPEQPEQVDGVQRLFERLRNIWAELKKLKAS